jgi:protein-disulfide isomerase
MDDALFHNQKLQRPVEELAAGIGLDVPAFRACLVDPETTRRLSSDIATGIQIGLKATPTYVVGGVQYTGSLPAVLLPPPSR